MRELKFRAKDIFGSWVYSTNELSNFFRAIEDGRLDRKTLSQYAELKDKNKKEIYGKDIVKFIIDGKEEESEVFFDEGGFSVNAKNNDPDYKPYLAEVNSVEVIGNVCNNIK